jgi:hypothetical protein
MVAAVKAKLRALQAANKEEESSGSDTEAEEEHDPEVVLEPDTSCRSVPWDKAQPQSPESTSALHADPDSDSYWEPSRSIFEEEEEVKDKDKAPDDKGNSRNGMEDSEQGNLEDAQGIVLQMLKDLCHGNKSMESSHPQKTDSALDLLQDCVALQMAQAELAGLAREKMMGNVVHHCILAVTVR